MVAAGEKCSVTAEMSLLPSQLTPTAVWTRPSFYNLYQTTGWWFMSLFSSKIKLVLSTALRRYRHHLNPGPLKFLSWLDKVTLNRSHDSAGKEEDKLILWRSCSGNSTIALYSYSRGYSGRRKENCKISSFLFLLFVSKEMWVKLVFTIQGNTFNGNWIEPNFVFSAFDLESDLVLVILACSVGAISVTEVGLAPQ